MIKTILTIYVGLMLFFLTWIGVFWIWDWIERKWKGGNRGIFD